MISPFLIRPAPPHAWQLLLKSALLVLMSRLINNQAPRKSILKLLFTPVYFVGVGLSEIAYGIKDIASVLIPTFGRGRRNRDFETAGRESQRIIRRRTDGGAVFRKGERDRRREVMEAERENRKFLTASGAKAVEYREQLNQRKLEYSRGESVNHLAKVNERMRQAKNSAENSDASEKSRAK